MFYTTSCLTRTGRSFPTSILTSTDTKIRTTTLTYVFKWDTLSVKMSSKLNTMLKVVKFSIDTP